MSVPAPTLLLLVKAPELGRVKTRLAASIGADAALAVHRRLGARQLAAVPAEWTCEVWFDPPEAEAEMRAWLGARPSYRAQPAGHLGLRLGEAFASAHARRPDAPLIAVGGDCPTLDRATLVAAAEALAGHEVVLGPAFDGGYYLIGLRRPRPHVFAMIPWSTSQVLAVTLKRIAALRLSHKLLPAKGDLDVLADALTLPELVRAELPELSAAIGAVRAG
jgi:hypothetical protein